MDEHSYENEYRTGFTHPQKNRKGLISGLLICVIFLCGIISVLSMLNIHLFQQLSKKENLSPVSFSKTDSSVPSQTDVLSLTVAGMTFQELPSLYQQLYHLPQGLYISQVAAGSQAAKLGIAPGDVLVSVGETPVYQLEILQNLMGAAQKEVSLALYRNGQTLIHTLTINK